MNQFSKKSFYKKSFYKKNDTIQERHLVALILARRYKTQFPSLTQTKVSCHEQLSLFYN